MKRPVLFPQESSPTVSIIVVAWRSAPSLLDCLNAVHASVSDVTYDVILVLNEPAPDLLSVIENYVRGVTVIRTRVNVGFAGAVNLAVEQARGKYFLLLNDDTEVEPRWLEELVDLAERRPNAGAVGSKVLFADGTVQEAGAVIWSDGSATNIARGLAGDRTSYHFERAVDYCSGCSLLIRRAVWQELSGMDTSYFPAYYEDVDFCFRVRSMGMSVWYQPRSRVRHQLSASTTGPYRSFLLDRNRSMFVHKWSTRLAFLDPPASSIAAIDRAVWRSMGQPTKILVIDDWVPDVVLAAAVGWATAAAEQLCGAGPCHLSVLPSCQAAISDADAAARLGVEVIDEPLEGHVANLGEPYSLVVIARQHNFERFSPLVRSLMPGVAVVYDPDALYALRHEHAMTASTVGRKSDGAPSSPEPLAAENADYIVRMSLGEKEVATRSVRSVVENDGSYLIALGVRSSMPAAFPGRSNWWSEKMSPVKSVAMSDGSMDGVADHAASAGTSAYCAWKGINSGRSVASISAADLQVLYRHADLKDAYERRLEEQVLALTDDVERTKAYAIALGAQVEEMDGEIQRKISYILAKEAYATHLEEELRSARAALALAEGRAAVASMHAAQLSGELEVAAGRGADLEALLTQGQGLVKREWLPSVLDRLKRRTRMADPCGDSETP